MVPSVYQEEKTILPGDRKPTPEWICGNTPDLPLVSPMYFLAAFLSFFLKLYLQYAEVPRPGMEAAPQQWQYQILNPLSHQGTLWSLSHSLLALAPNSFVLSFTHKFLFLHLKVHQASVLIVSFFLWDSHMHVKIVNTICMVFFLFMPV